MPAAVVVRVTTESILMTPPIGVPRDLGERLGSAPTTTPPTGVPADLGAHEGPESFGQRPPGVPEDLGHDDPGYTEGPAATPASDPSDEVLPTRDTDDDSSTHQ